MLAHKVHNASPIDGLAARSAKTNRASARDVILAADQLPLRHSGAQILDEVLRRHRITNATIAACWDCDEWIVRQVRAGERELTATKILAMPDELAEETLLGLLEIVTKRKGGDDGPPVDPIVEAQTLTIEAARALDAARTGDENALLTASARVSTSAKKIAKAASKGARK